MGRKIGFLSCVSCAVLAIAASPAEAQSADDQAPSAKADGQEAQDANESTGLQEIVVTAQKRSENAQRTPIAITAITGASLVSRQINSVEAVLQATPNVQFSRSGASSRIAVRGLGFDNVTTGGEQRVAYHVDGVYFSRPSSIFGTFFDVERVEVLRGPQGTLYGRNATAGAINVITRDPKNEPSGYTALSYGSYNRVELQGAATGSLSDTISARIAFDIVRRDGYGKNITNGLDVDDESTQAVRAKLKFSPNEAFDYVISGDYLREKDHAYASHFLANGGLSGPPSTATVVNSFGLRFGGIVPSNARDSSVDFGPYADREVWGIAGTGNLTLGDIVLTSLTSYRRTKFDTIGDLTALGGGSLNGAGRYIQYEHARQISQELRASYRGDWGSALIGAYYLHESLQGFNTVPLNNVAAGAPFPGMTVMGVSIGGRLKTDAAAIFAQADINLSSQLTLTLGGRYSVEKKSDLDQASVDLATPYSPTGPRNYRTQQDSNVWRSFDPKITLNYKPSQGVLLYASFSTAFKSGGYNLGGLQAPFNPEKLKSYEVGVKADWLNHRLRTNISAFHYDYKDLQATIIQATTITIVNAANSKIDGVEAEMEILPVDRLTLRVSGSLLNARYKDFKTIDPARPGFGVLDNSGNPLSQSAPHSASLAAEYWVPVANGKLTIQGESYWMGKVYFSPFKRDLISQPAYNVINAGLRYEDAAGWSVALHGRNLTNKLYLVGAGVSSGLVGSPATGFYGAPRTFSAEFRIQF